MKKNASKSSKLLNLALSNSAYPIWLFNAPFTGTTNNGDTTGDLFDLGGLGQSLPQENDKKKTPQDFLGGHSNLVNLDNLITNPSGNQMGKLEWLCGLCDVVCDICTFPLLSCFN